MKMKELEKLSMTTLKQDKTYYLLYLRKSSESEDRQVQSIGDQENALLPIIQQKDLKILKAFSESMSAKEPGRPIFNEMTELIKKRSDIKGILVWSLSRLSRNPVDTATIQWLLQKGIIEEIVTPTRTYTEFDSDFVMAIEGAQANRFIRDLRKDTLRGVNSKVERGIAPILAPSGYLNDTTKRQGERDIIPHPIYFTLMRKLFEFALTGSFTLNGLVEKAKGLGIRNSRDQSISKTQMARTVKNPFYAGQFIYAGNLHQGTHKPILTVAEFDLLQDIISGRSRPRKQKHDFPLTGLIRHECGRFITAEHKYKTYKNGTSQTFTYYRCSAPRDMSCSRPYVTGKELEQLVIDFLGTIKLSRAFVDWIIKTLNQTNIDQLEVRNARLKALQGGYDGVLKRLDNLLALKISPNNADGSLLSDEEFLEQKRKLHIEKANIAQQLASVNTHVDDWTELAAKTFDFASTAQERFLNGTIQDKKTIIRGIGSHLVLKGSFLEIQPRTPFLSIQNAVKRLNSVKSEIAPGESVVISGQNGNFPDPYSVLGG